MNSSNSPSFYEENELLKARSKTIVNYIVMLISLASKKGMNHEDLIDWIHKTYEEHGYYDQWIYINGYGNTEAFVKMFAQGRNLLYDNIEVNNLSDGYEVKTHTWYESEIPEAFFYFDMDAEEFANYSAKLAIKNAEKLGINLSIKKEGNIEIAYIKKLTNHSVE
ncbi:hypothetical protein HNR43_002398 [Anoxybacillus mongoliensis]|uniref:Uncharacterized protein n=1 Tax=Anoxybacillus mongoliensis TaxID=452565 RepID=A0A7W8N794_9BACL|nr:hypothetical protein [Anoxybacillus mongoliensis]MBB5356414.1 hypothetical protein [Anoxybacillus mongoliensis]